MVPSVMSQMMCCKGSGEWTCKADLPGARWYAAAVAYDGKMMAIGEEN